MSDLYTRLNRKTTRKIRTVQPKKAIIKTDTSHFEKISTDTVETIISNTRKIKENQIQDWIDQSNPSPFEILRRISEISLPHHNILSKIIPELEGILLNPQPPTEINNSRSKMARKHFLSSSLSSSSINSSQLNNQNQELNDNYNFISDLDNLKIKKNNPNLLFDKNNQEIEIQQLLNHDSYTNPYELSNSKEMKAKLSDLLIESHDYRILIMDKTEKIKELKKILEAKKEEKIKLQQKYEDFQYLLDHEKFGCYEILRKEKEEQEELQNLSKKEKQKLKMQAEYSHIYGENRRLRDDIQKLIKDINENHKFQISFAHNSAIQNIKEEEKKKEEEQKE